MRRFGVPPPPLRGLKMPAKRSKRGDAWAWLTKAEVAAATGYSVRNFSERIQPRLASSAVRGRGAALRFDVRATVSALVAYVADLNRPKPEDVDPLLGGEDDTGDALEAYRRAATLEKTLKNNSTQKHLVDRAKVLDAMTQGFAAAGGCGRKLVLKFGNDAGEIWNEGIDAMRDTAIEALKGDEPDDDRTAADR